MKKCFTCVWFSFLCLLSVAQNPNYNATDRRINAYRKSFWLEANLCGTLATHKDSSAKWQYQLDLQYRRMADANYVPGGSSWNVFSDPYQQVYRPWIHYWIKPRAVRLSLSPIGYWATWTPSKEGKQQFFGEYRICPQLTFFQKAGRLEIQQRYRYEFRWQSTRVAAQHNGGIADYGDGDNFVHNGQKMRLRYMVRFNLPLNGKSSGTKGSLYLAAWDELFLGLGANTSNTKLLDQNRFVLMLGKYFNSSFPVKLEAGYTMQYLPKYDMDVPVGQSADGAFHYEKLNWEMNHSLQIYLICDNMQALFKKRKK